MTPKEKAIALCAKFHQITIENLHGYEVRVMNRDAAKECAFIVVEEMISRSLTPFGQSNYYVDYWNEVKSEIEKL